MKMTKNEENNRLDSPMETNECDVNHKDSASARPTVNGRHHRTSKRPLTQQQKETGICVINHIVNTAEGSLFAFRYKISKMQN